MPQTPSTRWCPTPEQLMILEEMYRSGVRTPNAAEIQQITAHLAYYGRIEGKNVFYWFQNHKARERHHHKKRRRGASSPDDSGSGSGSNNEDDGRAASREPPPAPDLALQPPESKREARSYHHHRLLTCKHTHMPTTVTSCTRSVDRS